MAEITFDAPDDGAWSLDLTHWPRPVPRLYAELYPRGASAGMAEATAWMGSPYSGTRMTFVNGWCYGSSRIVDEEAELARRAARAAALWDEKPWRSALDEWDRDVKPAARRRHLELQRVDIAALDDVELAAHLDACCEHFVAMAHQHHRFNGVWMVPVHDFVAHVTYWTGQPPAMALRALQGHSAVSRAADDVWLAAAEVVRSLPLLRGLLDGDDASVADIRRAAAEAPAVCDWLDLCGPRHVSGFDFGCPTAFEMPTLLIGQLRRAVHATVPEVTHDDEHDDVVAALRDAVPAKNRNRFDELLADARRHYRIRDERGIESDVTAGGIVRLAILEAGERCAAAGRLERPEDLLEAEQHELGAFVGGESGAVTGGELARRREHRLACAEVTPPQSLSDVETQIPPIAPEQARLMRALLSMRECAFGDRTGEAADDRVVGLGAHPGTVEGVARVVLDPRDLLDIEPGEVLVMVSATEAINVVLPLVGAIVTDRGGVASHAAIVARECGLPAVVGCLDATARLTTGARVRVDGERGEVTVVE